MTTHRTYSVSPPTCGNAGSEEVKMTQAPAAIFKIPTESPQLARGAVSRARKAAAKPKATGLAAGRVAGIETRAATWATGK
jgi:hypothetical protein